MRERHEILALWRELSSRNEPAVLATVIRTEGSSYRLPGARLLLSRDGRRAGGVSGGCLEDDIVKKAWWLTEQGPSIRTYDTTADAEIGSRPYGLGCNGTIHILDVRITPESPGVLRAIEAVYRERRPVTFTQHDVFTETLTPPIHLLIFGAGDDAVPMSDLGRYLGWHISVFDGRAHYARRERFPSADNVNLRPFGAPAPTLDPWTAAILMTHSYSQDLDILRALAQVETPLPYLGILGPRSRTEQLLREAHFPENCETKPYSPVGLDLGGHGAEQVALAAVAEIQAVFNRRSGGFLRDRSAPIHAETNAL
jgi:xanthine/CO dehydrogenase XdhC/CoxF family maturation factor